MVMEGNAYSVPPYLFKCLVEVDLSRLFEAVMKKRERNHGTESSRIKSIRKKIDLKCMEMKEKMKQHKSSISLNDDEINDRVLIFRQMLFDKEEIPDEDGAPNQPIEKANDSKPSKTSKKSRKNKGEKEEEIGSINGKSKPLDLDINLKQKRTNNELKLSTPHSQIVNGISPALSEKSKASQKSNKNAKSSPSKLHPSVISDDAKHAPACKRSAKNSSSTAGTLSEQHHRNSRSQSAEKRNRRTYSRSMSPQERARDRSNDRHSSSRRSVHRSDWSPPSRSLSRSRSPSIRRRKGSPSHLDRRRITSARKRPVPYYRPSPSSDRSGSWSSYSRYSRSKSRSSFGASPSPATLHRLRCSRHGHSATFNSLDLTQ